VAQVCSNVLCVYVIGVAHNRAHVNGLSTCNDIVAQVCFFIVYLYMLYLKQRIVHKSIAKLYIMIWRRSCLNILLLAYVITITNNRTQINS